MLVLQCWNITNEVFLGVSFMEVFLTRKRFRVGEVYAIVNSFFFFFLI